MHASMITLRITGSGSKSGSLPAFVVAGFIVLTCAATLFKAGIRVETAADAAQALRPLAGRYCAALFAFGLQRNDSIARQLNGPRL